MEVAARVEGIHEQKAMLHGDACGRPGVTMLWCNYAGSLDAVGCDGSGPECVPPRSWNIPPFPRPTRRCAYCTCRPQQVLSLPTCSAPTRPAFICSGLSPSLPRAAQLSLKSYASFLNSSTSRWEALYDSWPLQAEFVDMVSPVFLSDRKT